MASSLLLNDSNVHGGQSGNGDWLRIDNSGVVPVGTLFTPLPFQCRAVNYYIPVHGNTALLSSHSGCSKGKIRPTLVWRPSTILFLLLFRQF